MARDRSPYKRLWKVRIYPSGSQARELKRILSVCCDLYNAALQQRKDVYRLRRVSLSLYEQCRDLTQARREWAFVRGVYSEVEANVLRRVDLAMAAFFRRVKLGQMPGFPRFKSKLRYDSFEFPHGNRCVKHNPIARTISLPNVGAVRYRDLRGVPETFTVVKVLRKNGRWYACFETVIEPKRFTVPRGIEIGVDVGVANLATTSAGDIHDNPRHGARYRRIVERHQRAIAKSKRCSKRRRKLIRTLARAKEREANARIDTAHKASRELVNDADLIVFEDLRISDMTKSARGTVEEPGKNVAAKSGLNRVILDVGWRRLMNFVSYKAAEAGRNVAFVDPKNTSRRCHSCGHVSAENRRTQSEFRCVACGHEEHADVNAARNILARFKAREGLAA